MNNRVKAEECAVAATSSENGLCFFNYREHVRKDREYTYERAGSNNLNGIVSYVRLCVTFSIPNRRPTQRHETTSHSLLCRLLMKRELFSIWQLLRHSLSSSDWCNSLQVLQWRFIRERILKLINLYLRMVLLLQEIEFFLYSFECVSYCEFHWTRLRGTLWIKKKWM